MQLRVTLNKRVNVQMLEFNFTHMEEIEVNEFDSGWFGKCSRFSHLYFIGQPKHSNRVAHIISTATGKSVCHRVLSHEVQITEGDVKVCSNCRKKMGSRWLTGRTGIVRLTKGGDDEVFDIAIQNVSSFPVIRDPLVGSTSAKSLVQAVEGGHYIIKTPHHGRLTSRTLVPSIDNVSERFLSAPANGVKKLGHIRGPLSGLERVKKELLWSTIENKVTSFHGVFTLFTGDDGDELHAMCRLGGEEDAKLAAQLNATATVCELEEVQLGLMMSIAGLDAMTYTVVAVTSYNGYVNYYEIKQPTAQDMTLVMRYISMIYRFLEQHLSGNKALHNK